MGQIRDFSVQIAGNFCSLIWKVPGLSLLGLMWSISEANLICLDEGVKIWVTSFLVFSSSPWVTVDGLQRCQIRAILVPIWYLWWGLWKWGWVWMDGSLFVFLIYLCLYVNELKSSALSKKGVRSYGNVESILIFMWLWKMFLIIKRFTLVCLFCLNSLTNSIYLFLFKYQENDIHHETISAWWLS